MIDFAWGCAFGLIIFFTSLHLIREYRRNRCTKNGHQWISTDDGFYCPRCDGRKRVGDNM